MLPLLIMELAMDIFTNSYRAIHRLSRLHFFYFTEEECWFQAWGGSIVANSLAVEYIQVLMKFHVHLYFERD